MIRICSTLSNAGYWVLLIGRTKKSSKNLTQQKFEQTRLNCFWEKGKMFYLEYNIRLFFYLLFSKVDIICAIDLDTILPGFLVTKLKSKPCVYDAHEYFTELPEVVHRPLVRKIWSIIADICIPNIKHCYTVGPSLAVIFEKKYNTKFEVIRNVPFRLRLETNVRDIKVEKGPGKIILYQGVLNEGRGLEFIIEAMQFIENAELWIAGEGDLSLELRELVKTMQLGKKIKFLGFLAPNELKNVTISADVGLNLLENKGLNYYYSLANKAFDYIQAEVPSIHMNFPEYQSINERYGVFHLIDNLKIETIRLALNRLLKDQKYYLELKAACIEAKKDFVWEKEEKKLLEIYSKI